MFTTPIAFASMVFICTTVGAGAGMVLSRFLPEQQLSPETKDIVRLAMGLVLTMTALVLGLVTASAKSTFDAQNMAVRQGSANVLTLDRMLAQCALTRMTFASASSRSWHTGLRSRGRRPAGKL